MREGIKCEQCVCRGQSYERILCMRRTMSNQKWTCVTADSCSTNPYVRKKTNTKRNNKPRKCVDLTWTQINKREQRPMTLLSDKITKSHWARAEKKYLSTFVSSERWRVWCSVGWWGTIWYQIFQYIANHSKIKVFCLGILLFMTNVNTQSPCWVYCIWRQWAVYKFPEPFGEYQTNTKVQPTTYWKALTK